MPGRALVTGGSAGIGRALAREFARNGHDLVVVARRGERLDDLADDLAADHGTDVVTLPMDLLEPGAPDDLHEAVLDRDLRIDALVNNAGIGVYGPFHETDPERERDQVRLNVELPVELANRFLPPMVERDDGLVLNVASLGAFTPGPRLAGYYASKAHVLSWSEALAVELADTGVTVTALCPGPVDTEFQARAGMGDSILGTRYTQTPAEVARAGYRGASADEAVVIPGLANKAIYLLSRLAPRAVNRRVAAWLNADR